MGAIAEGMRCRVKPGMTEERRCRIRSGMTGRDYFFDFLRRREEM